MTDAERLECMITRRMTGETLQSIGDAFSLTRERVRQLLAREGWVLFPQLSARCAAALASRATKPRLDAKGCVLGFQRAMHLHLIAGGYRYCRGHAQWMPQQQCGMYARRHPTHARAYCYSCNTERHKPYSRPVSAAPSDSKASQSQWAKWRQYSPEDRLARAASISDALRRRYSGRQVENRI